MDCKLLNESEHNKIEENIVDAWLEKYNESEDGGTALLHEDDNIKIVANNKPVYCSGWSGDGDEDSPDTNDVVLEVDVTVKNPNITYKDTEYPVYASLKDGKYYVAVTFAQSYEYVETYHDSGDYWNPPESDGYYEPSGDVYIPEEWAGPELFKNAEDAIKAVKNCNKHECLYEQDGVVTDDRGDPVFCNIGEPGNIYNWCDEAQVIDPSGVYPAYHQKQMEIEAKIDELCGKY